MRESWSKGVSYNKFFQQRRSIRLNVYTVLQIAKTPDVWNTFLQYAYAVPLPHASRGFPPQDLSLRGTPSMYLSTVESKHCSKCLRRMWQNRLSTILCWNSSCMLLVSKLSGQWSAQIEACPLQVSWIEVRVLRMLSNDYHSRSRSNSVGCRAQSIYDYTYDIDFTFPYISAINPQKSATAAAKIITHTATYIFNTTSDNEAWLPHVNVCSARVE